MPTILLGLCRQSTFVVGELGIGQRIREKKAFDERGYTRASKGFGVEKTAIVLIKS